MVALRIETIQTTDHDSSNVVDKVADKPLLQCVLQNGVVNLATPFHLLVSIDH